MPAGSMVRVFRAAARAPVRRGRVAPRRKAGILGEIKFLDTIKGITATTAAGTIFNSSLCVIPQGLTDVTRIGRRVRLISVALKGQYILPGTTTAADGSESFRIILYQDRQANLLTAAVLDILNTAAFNAFRNVTNVGRFKILHDKVVSLNSMAGNGTSSMEAQRSFQIFKKVNIVVEYTAETGALTEITSNNVGVLVISQAAKGQVAYTARVRYSDN